ncbi:MAG: hypothetical protein NWF05_02310 [Candidatus Bathyarchaeota archaeon]|nr:hypothetical protein [Candidatus Bathyarchaeota archaeon]
MKFTELVAAGLILLVATLNLLSICVADGFAENTWQTLTPMPTARAGLGVATVNGNIFAIGGYNGSGYLSLNEMYDPVTNTWTTKAPLSPANKTAFAAASLNGKIYAFGKMPSTQHPYPYYPTNDVYDPKTDTWEGRAAMPQLIEGARASTVGNKIYVIGGNYTFVYNPDSDSWTALSPPPVPVTYFACAAVDSRIYVIGGTSKLMQIYDTITDTWTNGTSPPAGGYEGYSPAGGYLVGAATTGVYAPKRIYVMGGGNWMFPLDLNMIYDPEADSWVRGTNLTITKNEFGMAVIGDVFYVVGGVNYVKAYATVERYAPVGYGPLQVSIIKPQDYQVYSLGNDVGIDLFVNRPATEILELSYSLDGQERLMVDGNFSLVNLPSGVHSVTVYATDVFGESISSGKVTFSVVQLVTARPTDVEPTSIPTASFNPAQTPSPTPAPSIPEFPVWTVVPFAALTVLIFIIAKSHRVVVGAPETM